MNSKINSTSRWQYLALAVLTLATYGPIFSADFVSLDDPDYVTDNSHVLSGLSIANWNWAWTSFHACNWHPLTWISLQFDAQLYGRQAAGYHVTNVILHVGNVLLLFEWLRRLTDTATLSLMVAALFAVHPLHVESVAWISERKDVLSTLFGIASLLAYSEYVRHPGLGRYLMLCGFFSASLAAKPMWVTQPILLILLDMWPLRRWSSESQELSAQRVAWWQPFVEKVPLCLLSLASCVVTILAQGDAIQSSEKVLLVNRLANALVSCVAYLRMTIWPTGLAVYYPYPSVPHGGAIVGGCGLLLLLITVVAVRMKCRCPALIIGWCWFLITLLPVIGIVQVGSQAYADRYSYLPHIGLFVAIVWGADTCCRRCGLTKTWFRVLATVAVTGCMFTTWGQLDCWKNSESLWRHTAAVTRENFRAHYYLYEVLRARGESTESMQHLERAVLIHPTFSAVAQFNIGNSLKERGQPTKAIKHLSIAVELDPSSFGAHQALGIVLATLSRPDEAIYHLTEATRLRPDDPGAWTNLGAVYVGQERYLEAIPSLTRAVELQPNLVQPLVLLASAEFEAGEIDAGRDHFRTSLKLDPNWPVGFNRVAWNLSTNPDRRLRNGRRAVQMARRACQATDYMRSEFLNTLAAAYAESGRINDAIVTAEQALQIATTRGSRELQASIESRLRLYREQIPDRKP